ncbi:valS [Symbiodinium natans]|uniref:ValS protein n=1 Tax=Symbiodinium natans TaxID=878477 RepID=A0A812NUF2_9DINO|nr:valS [Symbiodinium natans]
MLENEAPDPFDDSAERCNGLCESVTAALSANSFAPPTKAFEDLKMAGLLDLRTVIYSFFLNQEIKEFLQEDVASWYVPPAFVAMQLEPL